LNANNNKFKIQLYDNIKIFELPWLN